MPETVVIHPDAGKTVSLATLSSAGTAHVVLIDSSLITERNQLARKKKCFEFLFSLSFLFHCSGTISNIRSDI